MIEFVPAAHYFWITTVLSHACRHPHAFFFFLPALHVTLAWLVLPQRHKSELQRTTGSHQFAFSPSLACLLSTLTRLIRMHKELGGQPGVCWSSGLTVVPVLWRGSGGLKETKHTAYTGSAYKYNPKMHRLYCWFMFKMMFSHLENTHYACRQI